MHAWKPVDVLLHFRKAQNDSGGHGVCKRVRIARGGWLARVANKSRSVTSLPLDRDSYFFYLVVKAFQIRWSGGLVLG